MKLLFLILFFILGCSSHSVKNVPSLFKEEEKEVIVPKVDPKKEDLKPQNIKENPKVNISSKESEENKTQESFKKEDLSFPFKKGEVLKFNVILRSFTVGKAKLEVVNLTDSTVSFRFNLETTGVISKFYTLKLVQESQTDLSLNTLRFLSYSVENSKEKTSKDEYNYKTKKVNSDYNGVKKEIDFPLESFRDTLSSLYFLRWKGEASTGKSLLDGEFVSYEIKKQQDKDQMKYSIQIKKGSQYIWINKEHEITRMEIETSAGKVVLNRD